MFTNSMSKRLGAGVCLVAIIGLGLAESTAAKDKPNPLQAVQTSSRPVQATTSVTDALVCMDELMAASQVPSIPITIKNITDASGNARVGSRDMMINALLRMSEKSHVFVYTDLQSFDEMGASFQGGAQSAAPLFFIRGSISQFDEGVVAVSKGGGLQMGGLQFGTNGDSTASVITIDMMLGVTSTRQILPGNQASNSISFQRNGKSHDASAEIAKNGLFFQYSLNQSEGMAQAVRTLIEFNMVEMAGKMTGTPYWRCLGMSAANPEVTKNLSHTYASLSETDRNLYAQRALAGLQLYSGPQDGAASPALNDALGKFQVQRKIQVNGRVDEATYIALSDYSSYVAKRTDVLAGVTAPKPAAPPPPPQTPPMKLVLQRAGASNQMKMGEIVRLQAQLSDSGYLYCYLRDADSQITRVFPNRAHAEAYVDAGTVVSVPGERAGFTIRGDKPGKEEAVACFASKTEFGPKLPENMRKNDLEPVGVTDFNEFVKVLQTAAGSDLAGEAVAYTVDAN